MPKNRNTEIVGEELSNAIQLIAFGFIEAGRRIIRLGNVEDGLKIVSRRAKIPEITKELSSLYPEVPGETYRTWRIIVGEEPVVDLDRYKNRDDADEGYSKGVEGGKYRPGGRKHGGISHRKPGRRF